MPSRRGDVEVFLLERATSMAFAPDALVFPGGGVDESDTVRPSSWQGPTPAEWGTRLGVDAAEATSLVVAAARELFEEAGVLLAGPPGGAPLADVSGPEFDRERAQLERHEASLGEVLDRCGLALHSHALSPHARWVTPEFSARRFDTFFFAARCPPGQTAQGHTSEAVAAGWHDPAEVLARWEVGDAVLLPPTVVALERVAGAVDASSFVNEPPPWRTVLPRLEEGPEGPQIVVEVPT